MSVKHSQGINNALKCNHLSCVSPYQRLIWLFIRVNVPHVLNSDKLVFFFYFRFERDL